MGNCFGRSPVNNHSFTTTNTTKSNATTSSSSASASASASASDMSKRFPSKSIAVGSDYSRSSDQADRARGPIIPSADQNDAAAASRGVEGKMPNLKMFTLSELKKATRDFRPDTVLGEGGFGRVFKGWIDENTYAPSKVGVGIPVAVKKSNPDSSQGLREWQAEVKFLGKFSHPNLVKLLGYCWEENQFLLVYEHMQKGSLENHLFRKGAEPLSWSTRLKIAIGAARGLAFLHNSEKSVIYRDFKTSNILLDTDFNAKLSDFGLAKFGPVNGNSHVTTRIMGTYGYAAPEYVATGHLYVRSDVFGFGVVLLELLTGRRALDTNQPSGEHVLVDWARPALTEKKKLRKIMDRGLGEEYPMKGAMQVAGLVIKCLESEPKSRPSMDQVLDALESINAIKMNTKEKNITSSGNRFQQPSSSSSSSSSNKHQNGIRRSPIRQRYGPNGDTTSAHRRPAQ